jgi:hypothetical protein
MKRPILSLFVAFGLIGSAFAQVSFSNTERTQQIPTGETTSVTNNLPFDNTYYNYGDFMSGYDSTVSYGSLTSGTVINVYSSDAFHIYPWSRDSWSINRDTSSSGYSTLTLSGDVSGGSISLSASAPITAVTYLTYQPVYRTEISYDSTINYGSLLSGTVLEVYSSDAFHIYPWSRDSWSINRDTSSSGYSTLTLSGNVSEGSISLSASTPITAVVVQSVPEPSTYALFGIGAIGMLMVMRRKRTA